MLDAVLIHQIQQHPVGRYVGAGSNLLEDFLIGIVVEVIMISANIEKTIPLQPERLVNLKVKANIFHMMLYLFVYIRLS